MERIALPKNENKFQILNQYISNTWALSILPNIPIFRFVLLFKLFGLNLAYKIIFFIFGLIFNLYFPLMLTQNFILYKIQLVNKLVTFWVNTLFFFSLVSVTVIINIKTKVNLRRKWFPSFYSSKVAMKVGARIQGRDLEAGPLWKLLADLLCIAQYTFLYSLAA